MHDVQNRKAAEEQTWGEFPRKDKSSWPPSWPELPTLPGSSCCDPIKLPDPAKPDEVSHPSPLGSNDGMPHILTSNYNSGTVRSGTERKRKQHIQLAETLGLHERRRGEGAESPFEEVALEEYGCAAV